MILSPRGPVVIDWTNVAQGDGLADVAQTWVIMATSMISGNGLERFIAGALRRICIKLFLSHFNRAAVRGYLVPVAKLRLQDPNVLAVERQAIGRLIAKPPP